MGKEQTLTARTALGVTWNVIGSVICQGLVVGSGIVIARLLKPADYGTAGVALAVLGFFQTLRGTGFVMALVRDKELTKRTTDVVFTFSLMLALTLAAIMIAASPVMASIYGRPELKNIFLLLAVTLVLIMLSAIPNALLQRDMRFLRRNAAMIAGAVAAASTGLTLAFLGGGYWALIVPKGCGALAIGLVCYVFAGYRPRLHFNWAVFRPVLHFGLPLMASSLLLYLWQNADYLIMGSMWEKAQFGYYFFAFEQGRKPLTLVMQQVKTVVFPAFSQIQDDRNRFRKAFLRSMKATCLILWPVHVALLVLADLVIPLVFADQWVPAIGIFRVFLSVGFVFVVCSLAPDGLMAINRPKISLAFNVIRAAVVLPVMVLLASLKAQPLTVAIVVASLMQLLIPGQLVALCVLTGITIRDFWRAVRWPALCNLVFAALIVGMRMLTLHLGWNPWAVCIVSSVVASATYLPLVQSDVRAALGQRRSR